MECVKFIADIAANHDGDLDRAKKLIRQAAEAGANIIKFQHFEADKIVSRRGFEIIGSIGHQENWDLPIDKVYEKAELNREWTEELYKTCVDNGVEFMSSPYDKEAVDLLEPYVMSYKIGSGDITNYELIRYICSKRKRVIIATGASDPIDVFCAYRIIHNYDIEAVFMQCNTNYTAKDSNRKYLNLNYIDTLKQYGYPTGLSDHGKDNDIIIGAVAKGAKYIERHFTDYCSRGYPDHYFSMDVCEYRNMVNSVRRFEETLGDGLKRIEENEKETYIIQRRAWYANKDMRKGHIITREDIEALRPCSKEMVSVNIDIVGKPINYDIGVGEPIRGIDILEITDETNN